MAINYLIVFVKLFESKGEFMFGFSYNSEDQKKMLFNKETKIN